MGEKREPTLVMLLRFPSNIRDGESTKRVKIELFPALLWEEKLKPWGYRYGYEYLKVRYRVRVNGKWWQVKKDSERYEFVTFYQFRDALFRTLGDNIGVIRRTKYPKC